MEAALPPTAQVIADVIGKEKTLKLAQAVQFRSLYIPKQLKPSHWLVTVVGTDAAQRLIEEFPSMSMPLARCSSAVKAERNRKIAELSAEGRTVSDIARRLGIKRNTVQTILYRMRRRDQLSSSA
ncbi:hypothetical protein D0S45_17445 [Marinifilum sp. JC120]|nr:hypothetical protein D0S45_17445 [Marinifilum sp. JC120]